MLSSCAVYFTEIKACPQGSMPMLRLLGGQRMGFSPRRGHVAPISPINVKFDKPIAAKLPIGSEKVRGVQQWQEPSAQSAQAPPRYTKCNSPPINGQCTNFVLFDVAL